MNAEIKRCVKCRTEKPLSDFHQNLSKPDGRSTKCAQCVCEYQRARYLKSHPFQCSQKEKGRRAAKYRKNNLRARLGETIVDILHYSDAADNELIADIVGRR